MNSIPQNITRLNTARLEADSDWIVEAASFPDKATYLSFLSAWKNEINRVSAASREARKIMRDHKQSDVARWRAQDERSQLRRYAYNLLTLRAVAKVGARARHQAERAAA